MAWSWSSTERGLGLVAAALVLIASACARPLGTPAPVQPGGKILPPPVPPASMRTGSLWRDDVAANYPASDVRARFPGDLVTIVVVEDSSGLKAADTSTERQTDVSLGIEHLFGLIEQLAEKNPSIDPSQLVQATTQMEWDGEGTTTRRGNLKARITAEVTAVSPSGNLWVEGEKVVAVNREDQHIAVSGWVRPEDLNTQNEVLSTRLASARVEYYGVGVVGDQQREPWGLWVLNKIWPF